MKKIRKVITILVLMIVTMGFVNSDEWFQFESDEFKIEFPVKPNFETKKINSAFGESTMNIFSYDASKAMKDENLIYMVILTEYPDSLINSDKKEILTEYFRNSVDGAVQRVKGKLISEKNIEIDGFPGREIKIDYGNGMAIINMRSYLVKNKLFVIQTITETKKDSNKSIDRFMDSFKLKK